MNLLKKIGLGLCALAAVVCITSAKPAKAEAATKYFVTTKAVSVVNQASSKGSEVIKLPKEAVMILKEATNSSYYKVEYQNSKQVKFTGYIPVSAIKTPDTYKAKTAAYIRSAKKKSSTPVTVVPAAGEVKVVNTSSSWYKVVYYGTDGKVYRGYMAKSTLSKVVVYPTYKATTAVYMRTKASNSGKVVMVVPQGVQVKVTSTANSKWYKVSYTNSNNKTYTGYIYKKYLTKVS